MPNSASQLAVSLFEAWEQHDQVALAAHFHHDVEAHDHPNDLVVVGKPDVTDWFAAWSTAFGDGKAGVTIASASPGTAVIQGTLTGTNTGPFGSLPATGRQISVPWAAVVRTDTEGLISYFGTYYDRMTFLTQLGHMDE
jgi:steroid delta-isomerase-like uncharacterized protein